MTTFTTHLDLGCLGEQPVDVGYLYSKKDLGTGEPSVSIYSVMFDRADIFALLCSDTLNDIRQRCFDDHHERFGGRKCTT